MLSLIWVAKGKSVRWFHCEPTTATVHGVCGPQVRGLVSLRKHSPACRSCRGIHRLRTWAIILTLCTLKLGEPSQVQDKRLYLTLLVCLSFDMLFR